MNTIQYLQQDQTFHAQAGHWYQDPMNKGLMEYNDNSFDELIFEITIGREITTYLY